MNKRGQGTTEYLIILAVIIVIALVVVGVMGWFPGLGTGITEQQSKAYWLSASPLAIRDWKITTTGTEATFTLQNMTTDKISIDNLAIDGININVAELDVNIAAGATSNVSGDTGVACTSGVVYQYNVTITYDVIGGISNKTQTGAKPIIGICP